MKQVFFTLVVLLLLIAPEYATAQCSNPAGTEGEMVYNGDVNVPQYCDGANWRSMGNGSSLPACDNGDILVRSGGSWICSSNQSPGAFGFTDVPAAPTGNTVVESNIVLITGFSGSISVSVSGDGTPSFRTCTNGSSDANCDSSEIQTWTTSPGSIESGQYLQVRLTSNNVYPNTNSATVNVGGGSDQWDVTTGCSGTVHAGNCWYGSGPSTSCTSACTTQGGYNNATRTYAGDQGTDANCDAVLDALALGMGYNATVYGGATYGCGWYDAAIDSRRRGTGTTSASAAVGNLNRACACNN